MRWEPDKSPTSLNNGCLAGWFTELAALEVEAFNVYRAEGVRAAGPGLRVCFGLRGH